MDFFLFLLVTVALFLRPQDLFAPLADVPVYNYLIVANLVIAVPAMIRLICYRARNIPAAICVAGIFAAVVLSLVARGDLAGAWHWGNEFAKLAGYFLLLIAIVRTPRRFAIFLVAVVSLTVVLAGVAVANFHGQLDIPTITHAREIVYDPLTGWQSDSYRLAAYGVFADPNDLSMIVVLSMLICLGGIFYHKLGDARFALVLPLAFLAYVLALTQSRGGLLALIGGVGAFLVNRYGVVRSAAAIAMMVPLLLFLYGGRQTDISGGIAVGTGSQRTDLWYAGLQMMKWSPLWGIGHGRFVEEQGLVAHSSYIQALTEWGILGGTMFVGLFYVVLHSNWRLKPVRHEMRSPLLRSFQPYILGALAAYATAMLTLTRCDVVPTYLVAGLGVSFERLARRETSLPPLALSYGLLIRMLLIALSFLALTYIYIRFIYRLF